MNGRSLGDASPRQLPELGRRAPAASVPRKPLSKRTCAFYRPTMRRMRIGVHTATAIAATLRTWLSCGRSPRSWSHQTVSA